jgi:hypothetical protein
MYTFFGLLIALAVSWFIFRAFQKSRVTPELGGEADFPTEVIAESFYQPVLRSICGPGKVRHECKARIEFEDDNANDDQAVVISIGGARVGYLSRSDARRYRRNRGTDAAECSAMITGGGKDRENLDVWLDIHL